MAIARLGPQRFGVTARRLAGAVLIEQHDEWEAGDRRYFSEASMLELSAMNTTATTAEEMTVLPELTAAETETH